MCVPHAGASTGSVSCMHIEVGAILSTNHAMLSVHSATCTQRPAITTPKACCMQTEVSLPRSLTFRPVSSGLSKRCQQRSVVRNRARSSGRVYAVQQVGHTVSSTSSEWCLAHPIIAHLACRRKRSFLLGRAKRKSVNWQHLKRTCHSVCTCWVQQLWR